MLAGDKNEGRNVGTKQHQGARKECQRGSQNSAATNHGCCAHPVRAEPIESITPGFAVEAIVCFVDGQQEHTSVLGQYLFRQGVEWDRGRQGTWTPDVACNEIPIDPYPIGANPTLPHRGMIAVAPSGRYQNRAATRADRADAGRESGIRRRAGWAFSGEATSLATATRGG